MKSPSLLEIAGYKEPTYLIARIEQLEKELNDTKEKLVITEKLLEHFKCDSGGAFPPGPVDSY